jgi:PAS domain-containing protein
LQVHQVELEMQQEELRAAGADLEAALSRQTALYDRAPVAYLTLDAMGTVLEVNLTGARLLGVEREELLGHGLRSHLSPGDTTKLHSLMDRTLSGQAEQPCELLLTVAASPARKVLAKASADTEPGRCLVVFVDLG